MLYTEMTAKAMKIAFVAHKEQTDKCGMPYVFHPFCLAAQMNDEETVCTALLHDVVEDTDLTLKHLEDVGFTRSIIEALRLLTHDDAVPYMEYVSEIAKNPIARKVKLADLRHNSDLSRFTAVGREITDRDPVRVERYKEAMRLLEGFEE